MTYILAPRDSRKGIADIDIKILPAAYTMDRLTIVLYNTRCKINSKSFSIQLKDILSH